MNVSTNPEPAEVPGAIRSRHGRQWVVLTTAFRRAIHDPLSPSAGRLAAKTGFPRPTLSVLSRQPFVLSPTYDVRFREIAKIIKFDGPLYEAAGLGAIKAVSESSPRPDGPPPRSRGGR